MAGWNRTNAPAFTEQDSTIKLQPPTRSCNVDSIAFGATFRPHGLIRMAEVDGFEPTHARIKVSCLNQLGDTPIVWRELPTTRLSYEDTTRWLQLSSQCTARFGAVGGTRIPSLQVRSMLLYPVELRPHEKFLSKCLRIRTLPCLPFRDTAPCKDFTRT